MAWTSPRTWVTGETVTSSLLNTHVRDNLNALMVVTTKGDIAVATAAQTLTRLAVGADGDVLVSDSVATPGVRWSSTAKTAAAASLVMVNLAGTMTANANNDTLRNLRVRGIVGSGTFTGLTLNLLELAGSLVTKTGTGTVDVARTVYIDAPTIGTVNTPLYVVSGIVGIGDDRNANMTTGLLLNQGAATNEIFSLKSSAVAHGITNETETDTYAYMQMMSITDGGVEFAGFNDGGAGTATGLILAGHIAGAADQTRSTAARAPIELSTGFKSGASLTTHGADRNMVVIRNLTTARFIFDSDGDSHQDVGTAWTNFDRENDIDLLNTLAAHVTRKDDPLRRGFGKWLREKRGRLEELKLVTFNRDGHHFVNMSRLTMLHTGALRELGAKLEAQAERLLLLEKKVLQLAA